jgi:hypothetical protein
MKGSKKDLIKYRLSRARETFEAAQFKVTIRTRTYRMTTE